MTLKTALPAIVAAASAIAAAPAAEAATFRIFTDRAAFEAATVALSAEGFDAVAGEPGFDGRDLTVGDVTLRNDGAAGFGFIDQPPAARSRYDIDGTAAASLFTDLSAGITATIGFSGPVTAFGADFADLNNDAPRTVIEVLGMTLALGERQGRAPGFLGFTSDTAFASLTLRGNLASTADGFSMDNLAYGIAAVPLPAGGALLVGALGALGLRRRR